MLSLVKIFVLISRLNIKSFFIRNCHKIEVFLQPFGRTFQIVIKFTINLEQTFIVVFLNTSSLMYCANPDYFERGIVEETDFLVLKFFLTYILGKRNCSFKVLYSCFLVF